MFSSDWFPSHIKCGLKMWSFSASHATFSDVQSSQTPSREKGPVHSPAIKRYLEEVDHLKAFITGEVGDDPQIRNTDKIALSIEDWKRIWKQMESDKNAIPVLLSLISNLPLPSKGNVHGRLTSWQSIQNLEVETADEQSVRAKLLIQTANNCHDRLKTMQKPLETNCQKTSKLE